MDPDKIQPSPGWLFCRALDPATMTSTGLHMPKDFEKDVVSEGVAEVLRAGPPRINSEGTPVDHGLQAGDRVLYRGFLRHAQPCGHLFGADKPFRYFMLDWQDVMATLDGTGSVGFYGEYVL